MKKFFIALIGGTVVLISVAMLVLPGPGLLVIAGGLAILASEFIWARRALRRAKGAVARVRRKSGIKDRLLRRWLVRPDNKRTFSLYCDPSGRRISKPPPTSTRQLIVALNEARHMKTIFTSCLVIASTSALLHAGDWPQWRGPQRDGQFAGPAWPDKLDTNHLRQVWRVELGPSYSGPVVSGERVFTTETKGKKLEVVMAFDRKSGKKLWRAEWPGAVSVPFFAKSSGDWIRATPACDGESLFVAGMRDVLVCLDAQTGKERWRFDFVKKLEAPAPDFGFVCSPLVDEEAVYVQAGASFVKLNKRTGEVIWRTLKDAGGMWGSVFSSPVFAMLAGKRQLLVQTREKLAGVDPADGEVLWEQPVPAFRGMNILTPLAHKDILFSSAYGGKTIGFKVTQANGKFAVAEAWRHKAEGYMTTPVVMDGVAYTHLKSQRVMAIEVETGRELWTSGTSFGKYWSLIGWRDRILALDQRGMLFLLRASKERFDQLDQRKLTSAETWAHLAVADDELFVRELNALSVYRWGEPRGTPEKARASRP